MKRISFKDSEGLNLTQAVLEGRKTMTRRIAYRNDVYRVKYEVGEVVAIQQSYRDALGDFFFEGSSVEKKFKHTAGWANKMFVKAEYMPHHIRITDVRVERLRDISDEDCMREGITKDNEPYSRYFFSLDSWYNTPCAAFAALIDKVSGRGTWNSNPLVWAYGFELVD